MPSKGLKSTEFWMSVLSGVVMVANGTDYINIPWDNFMVWLGANGFYVGARTVEKVAGHKRNGTGNSAPPAAPAASATPT